MLVDVTPLGIGGKLATEALENCGITVNMNMIPYDARKPMDPSGMRIGTPALTTRGMGTGRNAAHRRLDFAVPEESFRHHAANSHPRRSQFPLQPIPRPRRGVGKCLSGSASRRPVAATAGQASGRTLKSMCGP